MLPAAMPQRQRRRSGCGGQAWRQRGSNCELVGAAFKLARPRRGVGGIHTANLRAMHREAMLHPQHRIDLRAAVTRTGLDAVGLPDDAAWDC